MPIPKITDKAVVLRRMAAVREVVRDEITGTAYGGSGKGDTYSRGLAAEGFAGGYLQALDDIDGALTHGYPSDHRGYWAVADRKLKEKSNAKNPTPQDQQVPKNRKPKHSTPHRHGGVSGTSRRPPNR